LGQLTPQGVALGYMISRDEGLTRIVSFLPREDWIVVGWVMAIKALLFSFGAMSYAVLWDNYTTSPNQWFGIWNQWDFGYYQEIAEFGYSGNDGSMAFYPLFPWLVRLVACVSRSYPAAGFIVSGIASVERSCCEDSFALITRRASQCAASGSFSFFPTAYFLQIGYSEGLFLALALACILAARGERWWLAGVLGAFCWMTRATCDRARWLCGLFAN
jgi:Gpi18-like mannosyltransferase